jgi:hypothetical protein
LLKIAAILLKSVADVGAAGRVTVLAILVVTVAMGLGFCEEEARKRNVSRSYQMKTAWKGGLSSD